MPTEERKLAAIMFTDMVGYSALAQRDDYGDGVNIASRIEAVAGAGGICVSMDVERQIRNALEARFEKFGTADLKNIKLPMDLFRIVLPWEKGAEPSAVRAAKKSPLPVLAVAAVLVLVALLAGWSYTQRSNKSQQPVAAHAAPMAPANEPDQNSVAV